MYQAIDAHTHLDFPALSEDLDQVMARAAAVGIDGVVLAGANPEHWDRVARVSAHVGGALCLGVHPWWVADRGAEQLQKDLDHLADRDDLDGIGETGLDWIRAGSDADTRGLQQASLAAHVELAHHMALPLVLHIVRAHAEALSAIAALDLPARGGMVHAWSAGPEWVELALELGLYLSFGTDVARSAKVRAALAEVPLDRLLIETDCPDRPLPPHTIGQPHHLFEIAELVAKVHKCPTERIVQATAENARSLFPILGYPDA